MRTNIPLLPISVEVRWRRLPPVTLCGLMIVVVVAGLFFALIALGQRTAESMNVHNNRAFVALRERRPPTPLETWHAAMAGRYRARFDRIDLLVFLLFMTAATLAAVAVVGRALDWSARLLGESSGDGPKPFHAITHENQDISSEEPRS